MISIAPPTTSTATREIPTILRTDAKGEIATITNAHCTAHMPNSPACNDRLQDTHRHLREGKPVRDMLQGIYPGRLGLERDKTDQSQPR